MHNQVTTIYLLGNLRSIGAGLGREAHFCPEPHQHGQPDQDWRVYFQGSPSPIAGYWGSSAASPLGCVYVHV